MTVRYVPTNQRAWSCRDVFLAHYCTLFSNCMWWSCSYCSRSEGRWHQSTLRSCYDSLSYSSPLVTQTLCMYVCMYVCLIGVSVCLSVCMYVSLWCGVELGSSILLNLADLLSLTWPECMAGGREWTRRQTHVPVPEREGCPGRGQLELQRCRRLYLHTQSNL